MHAEMKNTKKKVPRERRKYGGTWLRRLWLGFGIWAIVGLVLPSPSQAVDYHCSSGDAACLINAINLANANGVPNTIQLEGGTYTLTTVNNETDGPNGLPSITSTLQIIGAGAETTSIERAEEAPAFRILKIEEAGKVTLEGLALQKGFLTAPRSDGSSCFFIGDSCNGVGVLNLGTLLLNQSAVSNNTGENWVNGAGIYNRRGTLSVVNSRIEDNVLFSCLTCAGGGIVNSSGGILTMTDSWVVNNEAREDGFAGGISNGGEATLTNSTVMFNGGSIGGAITNYGTMTIEKSFLSSNGGGSHIPTTQIFNFGTLTVRNSTIANGERGILDRGDPTLHRLTKLINTTVTNHRIGIEGQLEGAIELENTIIVAVEEPDQACVGNVTSLGFNLIEGLFRFSCTIVLLDSDKTGDPGLGPLSDDGTPGNGHFPLLAGSQAINMGNDAACPPTDQLGTPRPVEPGEPHCDIGAIEFTELLNDKFAPLGPGDVATAFSAVPCGGASAGTFTITATFTNTSPDTLASLVIAVETLTGGNVLCNANGGPGGAGATLTVPLEGDLSDGQLSPGESFVVELPVGLQSFNPFTFLVDVLGEEAP